jgi:hypothetical protein
MRLRPSSNRVDRRRNNSSSGWSARRRRTWSRRQRWSQRQSRRRLVDGKQSGRQRRCHRGWGRFLWRHRPDRSIRQAIPATSPCFVDAIGDKRLALEKPQRLLRPVNAIAKPVGNVHCPVSIQTNDPSLREIEIRIMVGDNGIAEDCVLQFSPVFDSARNHRVGI